MYFIGSDYNFNALHPYTCIPSFSILSTKSPLTVFTPARVLNMSLSSGKRKITIDPSRLHSFVRKRRGKGSSMEGVYQKGQAY